MWRCAHLTGQAMLDGIERQRGQLFLWLPVFFALGIGAWFQLGGEPGWGSYLWVTLVALGAVWRLRGCLRAGDSRQSPVWIALLCVTCAFLNTGLRAHLVAEPVLGFRYYGAVEGRIVGIDRSASDVPRLTLDQVVLENVSPARTPTRVRVSLHGDQHWMTPEPGLRVTLTANIAPPEGPIEPGGFDFQRMAWFDGLGAVGYTRTPVLRAQSQIDPSPTLWLHRARIALSRYIRAQIDGQAGAFAAAILSGDRSGILEPTEVALRGANLSHLLAISGLHMGLLTGAVFTSLRLLLNLIPPLALRINTKKTAAAGALGVGFFYLALSGWNVATERAFVMVAVMFCAILLDRRAISLRAVAIAALIILIWRPEVLGEPGFQMSFAATTALVFIFAQLRDFGVMRHLPRLLAVPLTVILSSAIAGLATAPVAAAHFNRIADFGLLANIVAVPVMGTVIMPCAVLAALLAPLGLSWIAFGIMTPALSWILAVAGFVSGIDGAVTHVAQPPAQVLPLIALGAIFTVLWVGRARQLGVIVMMAGFVLWARAERPDVLISPDGRLVGVLGTKGRALSKPTGQGFAAQNWLENDGDGAPQTAANARPALVHKTGEVRFALNGIRFAQVSGRNAQQRAAALCAQVDVVILALEAAAPGPCLWLDSDALSRLGALSVSQDGSGVRIITAREWSGARMWNTASWQPWRAIATIHKPTAPQDGLLSGLLGGVAHAQEGRVPQILQDRPIRMDLAYLLSQP
ncbi:ComEC family competence protein [Aquimixticola soesokkakensis]|uniref:ComEC family competence protein n=1 Tax=Aquimixticola soesokkakensis TaxID=1519096 RepID=A0A1Y5TJZ3_9RHOB|nr:ComEC family competence protein [Aquimixticola soesokkakensis]